MLLEYALNKYLFLIAYFSSVFMNYWLYFCQW